VHVAAADAAAVDALEMRDAESGRAPPPDGGDGDDDASADADGHGGVLALATPGVAGGDWDAAADGVADIDASAAA